MPTVNEKILIALCVHIEESAQVVTELRNDSKVSRATLSIVDIQLPFEAEVPLVDRLGEVG